jgi:hypothetical protein
MLDKETLALLEENLLQNGVRDPIVLWNNTLIDGHNRYAISLKHGLSFNTVSMDFDSRDEVLIWIISTQVSRRNLSPIQLSYFRGLHYRADKRVQGANNQFSDESENRQNDGFIKKSTAKRLSEQYRVSPRTIERDSRVAEAISAIGEASLEAKRSILSGVTGITRKQLKELLAGSDEDIRETASRIDDGTFEKPKPDRSRSSEADSSADSGNVEKNPLNADIIKTTGDFHSSFLRLTMDTDTAGLKAALRTHINALEEFYSRM